ncbi:MAG: uracil-DNA glycosylase [Oscillospiraceae bacterium]|nr:uracil-DNA glycosylase [Oscillospiraceae bacterium]
MEELWNQMKADLQKCERCGLCRTRTQAVWGVGNPQTKVLFIGEAPGKNEDEQGEPFVGRSGQLLDKMLAVVDLDRKKNIYITNIVKCRPPENRDPLPEEVAACLGYLREQTRLLAPKIIVCLGRISATRIMDPAFKVTKEHGQWMEKGGIHMMGTFHPAALLRNSGNKPAALEDLLGLREKIRALCPEVYEL